MDLPKRKLAPERNAPQAKLAELIAIGFDDMEAGRTLTHKQLGQDMKSWGKFLKIPDRKKVDC